MKKIIHSINNSNILLLTPFFYPNIGGVETHLTDLCSYLAKKDYKVYVLTYFPLTTKINSVPYYEKSNNVEIYRFRLFGHNLFHYLERYPLLAFLYLTPLLLFHSLFFMIKYKNRIDVIHVHGIVAAFIGRIIGKLFEKRIVMSTHAIYNLEEKRIMTAIFRWILKPYDKILTLARRSEVELSNIGMDKSVLGIYTYWVDQEIFKPIDKIWCKRELGWDNKFIVFFVGRLIKIKGADVLINAVSKISKDIYVAIAGTGPIEGHLSKRCEKLKNTMFLGKIDNKKLNIYYNAADVIIVPSQYEEAFGRVILESLSCGTPVIASKNGGIPEVIDESVGLLIEPTVENIAITIQYLYDNPDVLKDMARNCRPYAVRRFSEKNAELIEKAYLGVI